MLSNPIILGYLYPQYLKPLRDPPKWLILAVLAIVALILLIDRVWVSEVDMSIISTIESSNNPLAYNKNSGAVGLFQITPICLSDYNLVHKTCYEVTDLLSPKFNYLVAFWYINQRIPQMLRAKGKPVTVEAILWAYNAGIRWVVKGICPRETRNYIAKYKKLAKGR